MSRSTSVWNSAAKLGTDEAVLLLSSHASSSGKWSRAKTTPYSVLRGPGDTGIAMIGACSTRATGRNLVATWCGGSWTLGDRGVG